MKIKYDNRFDTLCVSITDNSNSYGDDSLDDVILMRDIDTDTITGITILKFLKKYKSGVLPTILSNFGFSFEKDVLPNIGI